MAGVGQGVASALERIAPMLPSALEVLADDQLVEFVDAAEQLARQADALRLAAAREVDNRSDATLGDHSLARRLGQKNAAAAIEFITRTSAEDARRRITECRNLRKLPVVADAVEAGVLGRAQAAEIVAPLLPTVPVAAPGLVDSASEQLVELAATLPAGAVVEAARAWAAVLDPDGVEPAEKLAFEKRFVTLGRANSGLVKLTGLLTVEQAASVRAVIDAYANPKAGASVAFAPADDGGDLSAFETEPPNDTRTVGQKRADILHAVFAAQARDAKVPTMGGAHPTLLVTISKEAVESGAGPARADGEAEPLSAASARRIACAGGVQAIELGDQGEVLRLGRTERCFTAAQRRALAARDKGCVIPGCTIPARWCEAHHLDRWDRGGPTDVANGAIRKGALSGTVDRGGRPIAFAGDCTAPR